MFFLSTDSDRLRVNGQCAVDDGCVVDVSEVEYCKNVLFQDKKIVRKQFMATDMILRTTQKGISFR